MLFCPSLPATARFSHFATSVSVKVPANTDSKAKHPEASLFSVWFEKDNLTPLPHKEGISFIQTKVQKGLCQFLCGTSNNPWDLQQGSKSKSQTLPSTVRLLYARTWPYQELVMWKSSVFFSVKKCNQKKSNLESSQVAAGSWGCTSKGKVTWETPGEPLCFDPITKTRLNSLNWCLSRMEWFKPKMANDESFRLGQRLTAKKTQLLNRSQWSHLNLAKRAVYTKMGLYVTSHLSALHLWRMSHIWAERVTRSLILRRHQE